MLLKEPKLFAEHLSNLTVRFTVYELQAWINQHSLQEHLMEDSGSCQHPQLHILLPAVVSVKWLSQAYILHELSQLIGVF